ncbi:MAG: serine/threonine-protein kinase [Gaiellaceae bacterium]
MEAAGVDFGPGDRVGRYRLDSVLGEGAMGVVFRAYEEGDGRVVALKVLRRALSGDDVYKQRFQREVRVASEVQAAGLVPILEGGEAGGVHYLAVEYVDGGTLEDLLEGGGPLPVADVVRIVGDIAGGLDALHRHGVVHRDVKPSNVMLRAGGKAALTDFGLAKGRAYTVLTRPGQVMGTLDYIAPELITGGEATPASDIYALGCVAYECATGAAPFADRNMFEVAVAHMEDEPENPVGVRPELPADLGWVILQGLAKEPERRPGTAVAFANLLRVAVRA